MRMMFDGLVRDESGVTAIEYGLIAALIAVVIVTMLMTLGNSLNNTFAILASDI